MGGHNPNPNVVQLKVALRRLLVKQSVTSSITSNTLDSDSSTGLFALDTNRKSPAKADDVDSLILSHSNIDELIELSLPDKTDSVISKNILYYISGFIIFAMKGSIKCAGCVESVVETMLRSNEHIYTLEGPSSVLFQCKNRGGLTRPSQPVFQVICQAEQVLKMKLLEPGMLQHHNLLQVLVSTYFKSVYESSNNRLILQTGCANDTGSPTHGQQLT